MTRINQETKVLRHLQNVRSISGAEAADLYRIRDLPKRISVLRAAGHSIKGELKFDVLGQRYMRYTLQAAA